MCASSARRLQYVDLESCIYENNEFTVLFTAKVLPTKTPDVKTLQQKIKDMEEEHSRKVEVMARNHNMTVANLKEEFAQKIHGMKVEWEEEKAKLWTQVEFLKESLNQRRVYY